MSVERKDRWVQVRITREQDDLIKKFGGSKSKIWNNGFNDWFENLPEQLQEQAEYHKKKSIQCIDKLGQCKEIVNRKRSLLDEWCLVYIKSGRNLPHDSTELSREDRYWIESKIQDKKLNCDVDRFIERCKELKNSINNNNNTL